MLKHEASGCWQQTHMQGAGCISACPHVNAGLCHAVLSFQQKLLIAQVTMCTITHLQRVYRSHRPQQQPVDLAFSAW